jgi:cyanate permease
LGWQTGTRLAAAGSGIALLGMATFPTSWWSRWWPIAGLCMVAGVAAAISQAASNLAMVRAVPPGRFGLLFGLKHTAVPLSAILGGLAVPSIALTIGWRQAYAAAALLALATLLAVPFRPDPRGSVAGTGSRIGRPTTPVPALVLLAVAATLAHAGLDSLGAFVVPFAVSEGIAEGTAGVLLTVGSLVGLTVRLGSGWAVDRRQGAGQTAIAALLFLGSAGFLVLALGGGWLLVTGVVLAFAGGWGWAGLLTFIVVRANPDAAATATGIANTGKYVGAGAGPFLMGLLAQQASFAAAWAIAAGLLLAAAILITGLRLSAAGRDIAHPPGDES